MSKISISNSARDFHLYIDGIPHIHLMKEGYKGFTSWISGKIHKVYCIEITYGETEIVLEYFQKKLWIKILKILDKNL